MHTTDHVREMVSDARAARERRQRDGGGDGGDEGGGKGGSEGGGEGGGGEGGEAEHEGGGEVAARRVVLNRDVCGRRVLRAFRVVWPWAVCVAWQMCIVGGARPKSWLLEVMPARRGAAGAAR